MLLELIAVLAGLFGLWFGSDLLIRSGKNIARHFGISYFFFGLAFVSIGTSIPELSVSVAGAIDRLGGLETSGIVIGDTIGSALNQITLIMGVLALFAVLKLDKKKTFKEGVPLLGAIILFFLLALDGVLSRLDGGIFIGAFLLYYIYLYKTEQVHVSGKTPAINPGRDIVFCIAGLLLILKSSNTVVLHAVNLSEMWGVSQSLVGVLLIGLGTGLPEFSVAITGIKHKAMDMSMGNLLGSNICDLLLGTGSGAIISGFLVERNLLVYDLPVLFVFTLVFLYYMMSKGRMNHKEGMLLIGMYALYALGKIFFFS